MTPITEIISEITRLTPNEFPIMRFVRWTRDGSGHKSFITDPKLSWLVLITHRHVYSHHSDDGTRELVDCGYKSP